MQQDGRRACLQITVAVLDAGFDEVAGEHQKVNESLGSWRQARRLFYAARRGNLPPNAFEVAVAQKPHPAGRNGENPQPQMCRMRAEKMACAKPVPEFFQRNKFPNFIPALKHAFMAHGSVRDF